MPTPKLHENFLWNLPLPAPFDLADKRRKDVASFYNDQPGGTKVATLFSPTLRAILKYFALRSENETRGNGGLGTRGSESVTVCEYPSRDELQAVVYERKTGKVYITRYCEFGKRTQHELAYTVKEGECSTSAIHFALLPTAMTDNEFLTNLTLLEDEYKKGFPDPQTAGKLGAILCDNIYRRVKDADMLGPAGIKFQYPPTGNFPMVPQTRIKKGEFAPTNLMAGSFHILNAGSDLNFGPVKAEDFVGKYVLTKSRKLTPEEKRAVPVLEDWYIIPSEVELLCRHAKATTGKASPIRNFLLRGPAGTGKTEGAKAIAAGLNLPYRHITCSAGTAIEDLLGQLLPITEEETKPDEALPTLQDIQMDPASAYFKLTGEYREASLDEVYAELVKAVQRKAQEESSDGATRYRYVESPLIEALRCGYLVEIQEPSCISNPGVLVGLNSLLDNCRSVDLPTGKTIERHPDSVVVITTNLDYEGTRGMNQSILSRMQMKVDMKEPDAATMVERVMKVTGCREKRMMEKMVKCVRSMAEKCRAGMITDGSCGMRELISWAQSYMVIKDPMAAARFTVLPSATADEESQEELKSGCLDPIFS